tara:strand:+ start:208 stop:1077 length:870 start_codon:yes stop_codon:yes gene_type:complete
MKPSYEKLVPPIGESFRCFDRSELLSPVKWHRHPEIELTYIHHGAGSRVVGDHLGSYGDHDLVLLGSQLPHTWASDEYRGQKYDRHAAIVLQFHPDFLGIEFFGVSEMAAINKMLQLANRGLWFPESIAERVGVRMTALVQQQGASRLIELFSILNVLSECTQTVQLASEFYSVTSSQDVETRIQKICDHIANHLTDPELGHAELAELADMNASAFSRFFKQSTGRTLSEYICELRIGLACRLLTDSDDSILSISFQAGFANLSNFNRRFRQLRQMTPRDYRARFRIAS